MRRTMIGASGRAHSAKTSSLPSSGISPTGREGSDAAIVSIVSWIACETGDEDRTSAAIEAAAEAEAAEDDMMSEIKE